MTRRPVERLRICPGAARKNSGADRVRQSGAQMLVFLWMSVPGEEWQRRYTCFPKHSSSAHFSGKQGLMGKSASWQLPGWKGVGVGGVPNLQATVRKFLFSREDGRLKMCFQKVFWAIWGLLFSPQLNTKVSSHPIFLTNLSRPCPWVPRQCSEGSGMATPRSYRNP